MQNIIELSIITVNFNGLTDTQEFIYSVLRLELPISYELIVVDNGSEENEASILKKEFSSVTFIRSNDNLGFAGANNIGIKYASGRYLFLLNNDTLLPENSSTEIQRMLAFLRERPQIGGISPQLRYTDPKDLIQFAGSTPLSPITLRNQQIGYRKLDNQRYNSIRPIPYMHGAAMLLPRQVIEEVGCMPVCYFLYYEELEWSLKISKKYRLYYYPDMVVYHKESSTIGIESPLKAFYLWRSRFLFAYRNRTGLTRVLSLMYLFFIAVPSHVFHFFRTGNAKQGIAVLRGTFSFCLIKDKLKL